jgi:plastocyanin
MTGRTRILLAALALGVVVVVAACGGKGEPNAAPVAASEISMQGSEFLPNHATVTAGTTVTWRNDDGYPHDVAFDAARSPLMEAGTTFQRTFDEAGSFRYECTLHPGMVGRVTVTTD